MEDSLEVLKYKSSYYSDSLHKYGYTECIEYCVNGCALELSNEIDLDKLENIENSIQINNFRININTQTNKLTLYIANTLPIENQDKYGVGTYDIAKIFVSRDWVMGCYSVYLEELTIEKRKYKLIDSMPNTKTEYDMFDDTFKMAIVEHENGFYETAIQNFEKCLDFPNNKHYKTALYYIANSYAGLNQSNLVVEWLQKSCDAGYTNWNQIISDNNFINFIHDPRFVDIVKQMRTKYSRIDYCPPSTKSYLELHGILKSTDNDYY